MARRTRDRGLRKKANGWSCDYRDPFTGKQVQEFAGTKQEARELRAKRLAEIEAGVGTPS